MNKQKRLDQILTVDIESMEEKIYRNEWLSFLHFQRSGSNP